LSGDWASASEVAARAGAPPEGLAVAEEERCLSSFMLIGKLASRGRREYKGFNFLEEARSKLKDGAYAVTRSHEDQLDLDRVRK
jgi:hypothetical protein